MKVIDAIVNDGEISSVIDVLDGREVPDSARDRINEEVGQFILEQTLLYVADAKSPVSGESWKKSLNPIYAKEKSEEGGTAVANLELKGDMLQALDVKATPDGIKIGIFGGEALKADGHNNFSGDSSLPQRRFLPEVGQDYKRDIDKGIDEIINDILAEEISFSPSDFSDVDSSGDLYDTLSGILGISARAGIKRAVLGNPLLIEMLDDLDLLDLL